VLRETFSHRIVIRLLQFFLHALHLHHLRVHSLIPDLMKKKLYRNTKEKLVAGVIAGLAEYCNHDVVLFRLIFIVLLFVTGLMPGLLFYVVAWVLIPEKPIIEPVDTADYTIYQ